MAELSGLGNSPVQAVFNGSQDAVDRMVNWCQQGPLCTYIVEIVVKIMPTEAFHGFDVR